MTPSFHFLNLIETIAHRIQSEFGYGVRICGEIECVVEGLEAPEVRDDFWQRYLDAMQAQNVTVESLAKERGVHQFEIRLHQANPIAAVYELEQSVKVLLALAESSNISASFAAQPAADIPGNGLHIHVHLANAQGKNVFLKQAENLTPALEYALGGLLHTMPASMIFFAPTDESYLRFTHAKDHVPRTVSWGGNNRTCALRLPETVLPFRHIEHRVAGADANPAAVIWAALVGIHLGLTRELPAGAQMFGDANDAKYALPRLPHSLAEAKAAWEANDWAGDYGLLLPNHPVIPA